VPVASASERELAAVLKIPATKTEFRMPRFDATLDPESFVTELLPELFEPYCELWPRFSDVDLTIAVELAGEGGGAWTLVLSDLDLDVAKGCKSNALVTLKGETKFWGPFLAELEGWYEKAERFRKKSDDWQLPAKARLTNKRLNALERVKGVIDVTLTDTPNPGEQVAIQVRFNGADPAKQGALVVQMGFDELIVGLSEHGAFKRLVKSGAVKVSGDVGLTLKLAGAFV